MTEIKPSILEKKIIFKKYKLNKLLHTSGFSWVYEGKNLIRNIPVAIKIENNKKNNFLESEAYILTNIKGVGIPSIISFGKCGPFKILIEEFLGKTIQDLWESCPFKKDPFGKNNNYINDICLLAIQGIERLKYIHSKNIIHRDIKPQNFLIGTKDPNVIYLIDFGFAKKYKSSRTGKHIRFSRIKFLIGSLAFGSNNAIRRFESSRRDDLESFGYMLIYLAKGGWTPWLKFDNIKKFNEEFVKTITKIRLGVTEENLCKGLPNEFIHYMKYVKKLDFEQEPDYQYLINLFISILSRNEMIKNIIFFWLKQKPIKNEVSLSENKYKNHLKKIIKNQKSKYELKSNYIKRLYSKIKESLSKNDSQNKYSVNDNYLNNRNYNKINNKEANKINLKIQIFNTNTNKININYNTRNISAYNSRINRKIKCNLSPKDKICLSKLTTFERYSKNRNKIVNVKNNVSFFNSDKYNKGISNSINSINNSFNRNKNLTIHNNINENNKFFIKRKPQVLKVNLGLKKINPKSNYITRENSLNENLKKNIFYKPIFKIIKSVNNTIN